MSTGTPADPVCDNITASIIASPARVRGATAVIDPVCRVITPVTATQTATPPPPP